MVAWAGGEGDTLSKASKPESGWKVGAEVIRSGELFLPLISCSTQGCGPYTSPRHQSTAGPKSISVGQLILRRRKPENWSYPFFITPRGEIARAMLELVVHPPQHSPHLWRMESWVELSRVDPVLLEFHEMTIGYPGRVPVRAQHWWCSRDQGPWTNSMILCDKHLYVKKKSIYG